MNDIYITENDILNLLATNDGDFDQACGLDFNSDYDKYVVFYDSFVARDLNGKLFMK